jgi:hypothetical protein
MKHINILIYDKNYSDYLDATDSSFSFVNNVAMYTFDQIAACIIELANG